LDWLKTTTSVEVGQEGRNLHAVPELLAVYFPENKTLCISMKVMLWHGSCFYL